MFLSGFVWTFWRGLSLSSFIIGNFLAWVLTSFSYCPLCRCRFGCGLGLGFLLRYSMVFARIFLGLLGLFLFFLYIQLLDVCCLYICCLFCIHIINIDFFCLMFLCNISFVYNILVSLSSKLFFLVCFFAVGILVFVVVFGFFGFGFLQIFCCGYRYKV